MISLRGLMPFLRNRRCFTRRPSGYHCGHGLEPSQLAIQYPGKPILAATFHDYSNTCWFYLSLSVDGDVNGVKEARGIFETQFF